MKVSLNWLGRYVDLDDLEPRQVLDDLTMSTCEVEGIEEFGAGIEEVVVGHVVECQRHPDADKLSLTRVACGDGEPRQIVCGASNVAQGQRVAVIRPGDTLPGGMKIKKAKIRGAESFGMICSESELGLAPDSEGILVLPEGSEVGARLVDVLPVRDSVLEIDNKSINHRPDLWGHYGLARELAAILGRPLRPLEHDAEIPADGDALPIAIADSAACPRYTGLVVRGAHNGLAPLWLRCLLQAVGQRSIDLLVDLTNFVMLDLGQPMHAFDLRRVDGKAIGVRMARSGETIRTLDGAERTLGGDDLLITAADEPVALAGIMGGEGTMVTADTDALFVESANFRPATIRRTSTRLGLRSDASARFEKALDPAWAELAQRRLLWLLRQQRPGAHAAGPLVDPAAWRYEPRAIRLRRARLDLKLGVVVGDDAVTSILERLEFGVVRDGADFDVAVPSFRATKDVTVEDDLIEEVGRMYRYDRIPEVPLVTAVVPPPREDSLFLARRLVELCATELGHHEVYDYSFVPDALLQACRAGDADYCRVRNPVAPEQARIRRHVLPSLLGCVGRNLGGRDEVALFEHGKGYHPEHRDEHGLPREVHEVALVRCRRDGADPYPELRSAVQGLCERVGYPVAIEDRMGDHDQPWIHPGRTAALAREGRIVGYVGALHPEVCRNLKLPASTAIATVAIHKLLETERHHAHYRKISPFPSQPVDVALLADADTKVGDVAAFLHDCGRGVATAVELFEVYRGEGLPAGKKSLNFTVTLGSMERTLTAKDEERYLAAVRERASTVGAELRG